MQPYIIRKVSRTQPEACLASLSIGPVISNSCSLPHATFTLDQVHQDNYRGLVTSKTAFKIRNIAGECLTVEPGKEALKFKECSPKKGLFQVWSVCRHNRLCDVDVTWTPRQIDFPANASNSTSGERMRHPMKNHIHNSHTIANAVTSPPGIVNEVLYTAQNALKVFGSSENFLVTSLASFYPAAMISDAVIILKGVCQEDTLSCNPCKMNYLENSSDEVSMKWILSWMTDCNNSPTPKVFLSYDILHVPLYLFPSLQPSSIRAWSSDTEKFKRIVPSLKKYLSELESMMEQDNGNSVSTSKGNDLQSLSSNHRISPIQSDTLDTTPTPTTTTQSYPEDAESSILMIQDPGNEDFHKKLQDGFENLPDIDIRTFGLVMKNHNETLDN